MATIDPVRNKARVAVSIGYDAAATLVTLASGEVSKLPVPASEGAFNMIWWNATDYPDPIDDPNYEIVRITAITGNVLTLTRAQEGTAAATHNLAGKSYRMALVLTKAFIDQLKAAYPQVYNAVLSGTSGTAQLNNVPGLTSASKVIACWALNTNTPIGALSIKEQGDDGHVIVESTAEEGGVNKNIIVILFP